jgi:thioredoxin-like negative regulator of GroEL
MSVYHFWSPTCVPCNVLKPVIADLKEEFDSLTWTSVNIQNDPQEYCKKFDVHVVPTIVAVGRSGTIEKHTGTAAAGYYRILRNASR